MQFTTIKGEPSVSALAARIFGVGPRTAVAKRAAAALLEANPALADIKLLPLGVPIAVPVIADAKPAETLVALSDLVAASAIEGSRERLKLLTPLLRAVADDRAMAADAQIKAVDAARRDRAKLDEGIEFAFNRVTFAAEETLAEVASLKTEQKKALAAMNHDLDELLEVLNDV